MPDHPEIYRSQAEQYEALVSREDYQQHILPALRSILPLEGLRVVELGAGTGRLTCQMAPLVQSIHALDISPHMLEVASARLQRLGLRNWQTAVCDHRQLSVPDGIAGLAISGWSVCYVFVDNPLTWRSELDQVLVEMRRVVQPGGMFILLETLGTGFESPQPPSELLPYFAYLEERGFQRCSIRTDYKFENLETAQELSSFFFGDSMPGKIQVDERGVILPECTGIWWLKR